MGFFWAKYARRIFATVSTTSIPNLAPVSPTEATVDPPSPGSRLDADHPENGVLIPCLFTPSAIPSVAPDILRCAHVATRTDGLSVVSRTDCLPWHVSFCSDRRCLIRTLAELRHDGALLKRAETLA